MDGTMGKNIGEIDELKAKLSLIYWRDSNNMHGILSVGFYKDDFKIYFDFPSHSYDLNQICSMNLNEVKTICKKLGIDKSPPRLKADVVINGNNVSLKSKNGALPALLNHTNRSGIEKVFTRLKISIDPLDDAISDYWDKRQRGLIKEDVKMIDSISPFSSIKQSTILPLLSYFLFTGTGVGDSKVPATVVWQMQKPTDYSTWEILSPSQVASDILDKIVISIRSKKGMNNYQGETDTPQHQSIAKWTRYWQSEYRGALHIRG